MAKPKPAVSLWIIAERKRHGWKARDLSERLKALGYEAEESTVRTWEAGRPPKQDTIDGLERLFGSSAPRDEPGDLASAIRAQTEAMRELVVELREARQAQQGQDESLAEAIGVLAGTLARLRLARNGRSQ